MSCSASLLPIGIYGTDEASNGKTRGCGLWPPGYGAAVTAAGGAPVLLYPKPESSWEEQLEGVAGVVLAGSREAHPRQQAEEERFCEACRELSMPLLAVDHGLHVLNATFGGTNFLNLVKECPQALRHGHPLEEGLRHAIAIVEGTRLADIYGDGEVVVNSEHQRGVNRVAPGFLVTARALDGVIEAVEAENEGWFALGVQWHPASASASGLDIQLFRALVDAAKLATELEQTPVDVAA